MTGRCPIREEGEGFVVEIEDVAVLREVVGELGGNLTAIGRSCGVEVGQRGGRIQVDGPPPGVLLARRVLQAARVLVANGRVITPREIGDLVRWFVADASADARVLIDETVLVTLDRKPVGPRSPGQSTYLRLMRAHPLVFGVGPAGTGKTYLAVAVAVAALLKGEVKRLVLTRPAVEAGEKLGFLPGDLAEKVDPYLRPLFDAMGDFVPEERVAKLLERRVVEVAPLAFMRGRTLQDAWVLLDEAQNTTVEQMKMFLTRLGERSRMTVTGDDTQVDLPIGRTSGLAHALRVLADVPGVGVARFGAGDVVRHPLVARIIDAYAADEATRSRAEGGRGRFAGPDRSG